MSGSAMHGLYLHIPFCRRKCGYCDFFSIPTEQDVVDSYAGLLIQHLRLAVDQRWRGPVSTLYIGGGTPSLLSASSIATLLREIDQQLGIAGDAEITLEANPGTVNPDSLAGYRAAGVNRLSLGLQTTDDRQLAMLGRSHTFEDGRDAVAWARKAGFDNISLDLIFALPGQSVAELDKEIDAYLALAPEHLSCYGLTVEDGTVLFRQVANGQVCLPDDDAYAEQFLRLDERLEAAGYRHYEIANYARDGLLCRHNLGYWERRPYLGLGAGAHSFLDRDRGVRLAVPSDLGRFRQSLAAGHDPAVELETFDRRSALGETIYLALRTARGLDEGLMREKFGSTLDESYPDAIDNLSPWLQRRDGCWAFSPAGWLLYDRLIQAFL